MHDCPSGYRCHNDSCLPPSVPDCAQGCPQPSVCGTDGICVVRATEGGIEERRCRFSEDCGKTQFCYLGRCWLASEQHSSGGQWAPSLLVNGTRRRGCESNSACPQGYSCHRRRCVYVEQAGCGRAPLFPCRNDSQCAEGEICHELSCFAYWTPGGVLPQKTCLSADDCRHEEVCHRGRCHQMAHPADADDASLSCRQHSHCDEGFVCFAGRCVALPPEVEWWSNARRESCTEDGHCPSRSTCFDGDCLVTFPVRTAEARTVCKDDRECAEGEICLKGGCCKLLAEEGLSEAEPTVEDVAMCSGDGDCPMDWFCYGEQCVAEKERSSCVSTANCTNGKICHNNKCVVVSLEDTERCEYHSDCFYGDICLHGRCTGTALLKRLPCETYVFGKCGSALEEGDTMECQVEEICEHCTNTMKSRCKFNRDCPPTSVCYNEYCTPPLTTEQWYDGWQCFRDEDCPVDMLCNRQRCIQTPATAAGRSSCSRDNQCLRGYVCHGGNCVRLWQPRQHCLQDEECPESQICYEGSCCTVSTPNCTRPSHCPYGKCLHGRCTVVDDCVSHHECPHLHVCIGRRCVPLDLAPMTSKTCFDDEQCAENHLCYLNRCIQKPVPPKLMLSEQVGEVRPNCTSESDCPPHYTCISSGYCVKVWVPELNCRTAEDCQAGYACNTAVKKCSESAVAEWFQQGKSSFISILSGVYFARRTA